MVMKESIAQVEPEAGIRMRLLGLPRAVKQIILLFTDVVLLPSAVWLAYSIRSESLWLPASFYEALPALIAVFTAIVVFIRSGLYLTVVRYMNASSVNIMMLGISLATLMFSLSQYVFHDSQPKSVPLLFWFIALAWISGVRLFAQLYLRRFSAGMAEPVIIYGAGSTGTQLKSALTQSYRYSVVAYVDDNPHLWNMVIQGVKVYAPVHLSRIAQTLHVRQIFLAIPSASQDRRRAVIAELEPLALKVKTLPSMGDVLMGSLHIDDIRDVEVHDLLGREPVPPLDELLKACIEQKVVLVTGAAGSIGSELCRQILKLKPKRLVLLDISEYSLYMIQQELTPMALEHGVELYFMLGNVTDRVRMHRVMTLHKVNTVYHAAAYKHVPMVEDNIIEGVRNNVLGTQITAEIAEAAGVDAFVFISTDKAVRPTNVMGASKRLAEMIVQARSKNKGRMCYSIVRFGNVLGSSGSVVPLFMQQICQGGPVTVTHPEAFRYFMSMQEAAQLVIQAGSMAQGGDVFLLDMGAPVRIADLARKMIHLAGMSLRDQENPEGDIALSFVGLRPGEKLYEELLVSGDVVGTAHPRILRAQEHGPDTRTIADILTQVQIWLERAEEAPLARFLLELASQSGDLTSRSEWELSSSSDHEIKPWH
ncbi:MAG: polysaccharide biosynthesis protein [Pseudomonadales bacterium]|nr:polysaccharide biosynthesis protein [Pseudomonadales bacterium]